jgi:signal transduction histidine kinase
MSREIIKLFNEYYQIYLNGNTHNLIDSYIQKNLIYIFKLFNKYYLSDINNNDYSKYTYIDAIMFNSNVVGYLYVDIEQNNIKNEMNKDYELFLYYLGILVYNNKILKYETKPHIFNKFKIFDEIFNILNDGIFICDKTYEILYKNNASEIFINTINCKKNKENIHNICDVFSYLKDILKPNEIFKNKKINYKCENNNIILNLIISINTVLYDNDFYNVIIITNNTKVDKLSNDSFISHELRNPLQSISFANYLLQTKNKDDILKKYLNIINKSVYDMIKIINDILDIDRIDSNKLNITIENIFIKDLLDNINFQYSSYINDNIDFKIIVDDNIPKTLFTDSTRTKQIILNLLINSLKYSKPNVKNNITLDLTYDFNNKCIEFNIIDNGIGIKDTDINNIFKHRYNSELSASSNNSNGLGLYICNKLANLLGGYIKIDSKYMCGSKFTFIHPINLGNINLILQKNIENLNINGNILISDSIETITLLLSDILTNIKYKYDLSNFNFNIINNKDNIIDMIETSNYDMIFIDINDITDINLIKILRRKNYSGKIILMTQNINIKLDQILFDGILIKPFSENDVLNKIKLL